MFVIFPVEQKYWEMIGNVVYQGSGVNKSLIMVEKI